VSQKIEVITSKIGWAVDGADYTHFSTWLASSENDDPSIFQVGIVRGNDFMSNSYPEPFQDLRHTSYFDYLLVNTSGRIIAWNHGKDRYLDEHSLDEDSRRDDWDSEKCIKAIKHFIQEKISKDYEIDLSIYTDTDIDQKSSLVVPAFNLINSELIEYLANNPKALHSLHWRKFEELLAEIFKNQGFETELGPGQADGGVDLRLIQRSDIGDMLILVQAKKYAEHRKIQLDPVKALWASVEDEQANKGILVSTSEFIPAAKNFAKRHPYRLELAGPERLLLWLRSIGKHT
jgi:HJR/Mrr/RecB family endonuclease